VVARVELTEIDEIAKALLGAPNKPRSSASEYVKRTSEEELTV
jgi:hypothetical protein